MLEQFERIYATNEWGHGSGEGSLPEHNKGYSRFLERFIAARNIGSVVDMGCGDWQFSKFIRWGQARYQGFDIVPSVVGNNQRQYAADGVEFHLYSGKPADLPAADLLIAKDVLQHWSDGAVRAFLPQLARYRFALLTNCVNPSGPTLNSDIADGDFRYLDLRLPPFKLAAEEVFSFTNSAGPLARVFGKPRWRKRTLLFRNDAG